MLIQKNVPLSQFTTFRIGGPARYFCSVKNESELLEAVRYGQANKQKIFILGEGSNVLISDAGFHGLVIRNEMKGIRFEDDKNDANIVYGYAKAGELWDNFVDKCVERGLYGVENLSAIPGTVGAAPVQNIGAYGCDISETVKTVRALDLKTMKFVVLTNKECEFGYRDSLFKEDKDRYVITEVEFELTRNGHLNTSYRDLVEYFRGREDKISLRAVRNAVIEVRWKKLPDWKLWGNAGSFFKNPIISESHYNELKVKYPELPGFPETNGNVKVPLGWVLDKICKMRGVFEGNVGTHDGQSLVIVVKPGATSEEVVRFSKKIMEEVKAKTNIEVEGEVQWVN